MRIFKTILLTILLTGCYSAAYARSSINMGPNERVVVIHNGSSHEIITDRYNNVTINIKRLPTRRTKHRRKRTRK